MKVNIHTCFQKITDQNQTRRNLVGLAGVKEEGSKSLLILTD